MEAFELGGWAEQAIGWWLVHVIAAVTVGVILYFARHA